MSPQELIGRLSDAIRGLDTAVLVGLAAFLAILVILAAVAYAVYLRTPKGRLRSTLMGAQDRGNRNPAWVIRIGVPLLLIATLFGVDAYMSQPSTCAQCHDNVKATTTALKAGPHASTDCIKCHAPAGITGISRRMVMYARWVAVYGITKQEPEMTDVQVSSESCAQCHDSIGETTVAQGIRVRHSDFIDGGSACVDCHGATAHPEPGDKTATKPTMATCLPCHDGKKASATCESCHVYDVARTPSVNRGYRKLTTTAAKRNCYSCHDSVSCTNCHGAKMPHPEGYGPSEDGIMGGLHARDGFTNREICGRCHGATDMSLTPSPEGCKCHGLFGPMHGGKPWVAEHGPEAIGQKQGLNSRCFDCHSQTLCDNCHPPSYRKRYNPIGGSDSYQRDIPPNPLDQDW